MAEINSSAGEHRQRGRVCRSKKLSTKVDLTPMVDLGFLLITFFVFTTSMSQPKAMRLVLPADSPHHTPWGETGVLTLIPLGNQHVFYYHGDLATALKEKMYGTASFAGAGNIGDIIRQKQAALDHNAQHSRKDMMVIIKPAPEASYKEVVNMLDEMLVNDLKHYALVDIDAAEKEIIQHPPAL